jgi:hypothetical protein
MGPTSQLESTTTAGNRVALRRKVDRQRADRLIVNFVPEGDFEPQPTVRMLYSGTISVEPATFEALPARHCRSYRDTVSSTSSCWATAGDNQRDGKRCQRLEPELVGRKDTGALPAGVLFRGSVSYVLEKSGLTCRSTRHPLLGKPRIARPPGETAS